MTRTNYFIDHEAIAFKINTQGFKNLLKQPQPNLEIFVYHPEFIGVHLRMTKVSRGGLRWSDRDDLREEIKSLMITQDGKNSIIVPAGAKGGFKINLDRSQIDQHVFKEFYSNFINNLLDLVDNRVDGKIVTNPKIKKYDGDDTYFVVAADKGTSKMSDVANLIASIRNFWLQDAFASGGSNGYSHKDLGITAKGSFVSTARFFIEKGQDIFTDEISVIGIGSMNGDVFGNGISLNPNFKLLGAISHREIFIDPNPDLKIAYQERLRLFKSEKGGWSNYNPELISKGGGVFRRDSKKISISPEMKKVFQIKEDNLSGSELIKKLLTTKVDLLFNGGVGTYVKASDETNDEVGDLGNSAVRVDAKDLQAFAVCEGGNLGFTQKARVEFAKKGGKINLDSIDNSAGVNISDHEVNLKIFFSMLDINFDERNKMLQENSEDIVNLVLEFNRNQALALSLDEVRLKRKNKKFIKVVKILEKNLPQFKREYFAFPNLKNSPVEFVRPNLAFLLSYSKIFLTELILNCGKEIILEDFANLRFLINYFPPKIADKFMTEIIRHPLKNEIIATMISDRIINLHGSTFITKIDLKNKKKSLEWINNLLALEKIVKFERIPEEKNYLKIINFANKLLKIEKKLSNDF